MEGTGLGTAVTQSGGDREGNPEVPPLFEHLRGAGWRGDSPQQSWGQVSLRLGGDSEGQTFPLSISGVQDGGDRAGDSCHSEPGGDSEGQTLPLRISGVRDGARRTPGQGWGQLPLPARGWRGRLRSLHL